MPDPPEPQDGAQAPQRASVFTRQLGPLKTWQWAALIGLGGGVLWYLKNRNAATSSSADTSTADQGTGDPGSLDGLPGIVGPQGPAGPPGKTGKAGPPGTGTKSTPKPGQHVGGRVSASDFPKTIYGLTQQGRNMVQFATIRNHRIVGKNVGKSGAPVYALVNTGYGPVWEQGFNAATLPNGTKIATLPQFKSDIKAA